LKNEFKVFIQNIENYVIISIISRIELKIKSRLQRNYIYNLIKSERKVIFIFRLLNYHSLLLIYIEFSLKEFLKFSFRKTNNTSIEEIDLLESREI